MYRRPPSLGKNRSLSPIFPEGRRDCAQAKSYPFFQNHGWIRGAGRKDLRSGNKKWARAVCATIKPKSIL